MSDVKLSPEVEEAYATMADERLKKAMDDAGIISAKMSGADITTTEGKLRAAHWIERMSPRIKEIRSKSGVISEEELEDLIC